MSRRLLRAATVALVLLVGLWAAGRISSTRTAARPPPGITVPAAAAGAPTAGDVTDGFDTAVPPVVKVPERVPDFSLADRSGKLTSIKSWDGKSLIINFWATWCQPCRREIPLLEALNSRWAGRGVAVIGIAVDHRDRVAAYADELKIAYPLLVGEQDALEAAAAFGVESPAFPFTVFTDRRGEVVALYVGELHQAQADLILSQVQDLDRDRIALPQARRAISEGLRALVAAKAG
ncbi:MAG: TlpA family protein disulfide reductase [Steroidobacteraceae bacterium]